MGAQPAKTAVAACAIMRHAATRPDQRRPARLPPARAAGIPAGASRRPVLGAQGPAPGPSRRAWSRPDDLLGRRAARVQRGDRLHRARPVHCRSGRCGRRAARPCTPSPSRRTSTWRQFASNTLRDGMAAALGQARELSRRSTGSAGSAFDEAHAQADRLPAAVPAASCRRSLRSEGAGLSPHLVLR